MYVYLAPGKGPAPLTVTKKKEKKKKSQGPVYRPMNVKGGIERETETDNCSERLTLKNRNRFRLFG